MLGRLFSVIICLLFSMFTLSCATNSVAVSDSNEQAMQNPLQQATRILSENLIVDGHVDVPYRLENGWVDVTQGTAGGDFDYPRAKAGGLSAPFMSIYIPARLEDSPEALELAHKLIDSVEAIVGRAPNKFALAYTVEDVERNFAEGLISLPMGMENGAPIQGSYDNLKAFYDRGIRYITLAHSRSNHISDSSYDPERQWQGLSPFGKDLVLEMNQLGMMIDVSHVSDDAFYDVMAISKAPVIASHSSLRTFTPGFERNMSDDMVKKLADNDGVIMINFGSGFISKEARDWSDTFSEKRSALIEQFGADSIEVTDFATEYRTANPYPYANTDMVLDHIDYVRDLVGIEYIGLGSDYDGVGDSLPKGLKDASSYPNLVAGLIKRGYSEAEIKMILNGNVLRVWRKVEAFAATK